MRTRRSIIWALLFTTASTSFAGRLENAFAALKVYDYFKARELFEKQTKRDPAAAWYGLSIITGRTDNPFHQLDSSYLAILRADSAYPFLDPKRRERIATLGVDSAAIASQLEYVLAAAWERTQKIDSIPDYQLFIDRYRRSDRTADAVARRDELALKAAKSANTAQAYGDFLARYPEALGAYEARSRLQEAIFREATFDGTLPEYVAFIKDHSDSPYLRVAQDQVLELSTPQHTAEEFAAFIRRYPQNPNVPEAWRSIYATYTADLTVANIARFRSDFPEYPFMDELDEDATVAGLDLYPFRQDGKWGFIDELGEVRIPAQYEFAESFKKGQALVGLDGRVGSINKLGNTLIPVIYDEVLDYNEDLATVGLNDKEGVVDRRGRPVVPLEFDAVGDFEQGLAYAAKKGAYGFIGTDGAVMIPFVFDGAMTFQHGLAVVAKDDQSGVVDHSGTLVVPFQYDWIEGFASSISRVRKAGKMGMISIFGDILLPVEHDHVGVLSNGLALVIDQGKCGYVDPSGKWVIAPKFEANALTINMGDFHNGVARVLMGGKWALIDVTGERIFPAQYADIGLMEGGVVPVKRRNKWGYASRDYTTIAAAKYDQAWELKKGYGRVQVDSLFGLIDSTGKEAIAPSYLALGEVVNGTLIARTSTGTGVIDIAGNVLVPLIYSTATFVDEGMLKVTLRERFAYIRSPQGTFLWKEEGFASDTSAQ